MDAAMPFVHLLKTPLAKYIYDVNTGEILKVSEETYCAMERILAGETVAVEEHEELQNLMRRGYLSNHHPTKIEHPMTKYLKSELDTNIEQLTIQLTQQCNFRCDYCVYTARDYDLQRTHSVKRISEEKAKQAIDFLVMHSTSRSDVCVGFYGGEPLLEFELLKKLVVYAEDVFEGKHLRFTMTTNGSLFCKEEAAFLNEHNFSIMISLDGSKEAHDRNRKYAKNGAGSYDDIKRNVVFIQNNYPKLYERIMFNVVIDPRFPCNELYAQLDSGEIFTPANTRTTLIDDAFMVENVVEVPVYREQHSEHLFKAYLAMVGRYPADQVSYTVKNIIGTNRQSAKRKLHTTGRFRGAISHGGPCIPGQKRLFVNCDGIFYPCEKVSETSKVMQIGSIESGVDLCKADALLNICRLTEKECNKCWMIRMCDICSLKCDDDGELSAALKRESCRKQQFNIEYMLDEYLFMKEFVDSEGGD